jgi:V/A-type H+-transporting ATPase subunit D
MLQPTRTNLLHLREKAASITSSIRILKARRQALIREFLNSSQIFLKNREEIKKLYRQALVELHLALGHEGAPFIESLAITGLREIGFGLEKRNVMGVKFWEVTVADAVIRSPPDRHYDYAASNWHVEEAIYRFEKIVEEIMRIAAHESKLKRLSNEIVQVSRRTRVMEERILPTLRGKIKAIEQYLSERERESYFRLKRFKEERQRTRSRQ